MDSEGLNIAERVWSTPGILDLIVSSLPGNEVACCIRIVNKFSAALFDGPEHTTVHLSSSCPTAAFKARWAAAGAMRTLTLKQRHQFIYLTASSGNLNNLELAVQVAGCVPRGETMEAAAASGQLDSCKWLHERGCPWGNCLSAAARAGRADVCDGLLAIGCPWKNNAVRAAAEGGHPDLMERLRQQRPATDSDRDQHPVWLWMRNAAEASGDAAKPGDLVVAAAEGCDLDTLMRLHAEWQLKQQAEGTEFMGGWLQGRAMAAAAGSPTRDWRAKMEWLEGQGYPRTADVYKAAAGRPDSLERLTWLRQRGYPPIALQELHALRSVEALQFVLTQQAAAGGRARRGGGGLPDTASGAVAIEVGDLAFLQALHAAGRLGDPAGLVQQAAQYGQLPVLVWAAQAFGSNVISDRASLGHDGLLRSSASSGNVEVIAWVWERNRHEQGDFKAMNAAVWSGCAAVLDWMEERGFLGWGPSGALFETAACRGDLATLRWLLSRLQRAGAPEERSLFSCAPGIAKRCLTSMGASPAVLRWLVEEAAFPLDWEEALEAAGAAALVRPEFETVVQTRDWLAQEVMTRRRGGGVEQQEQQRPEVRQQRGGVVDQQALPPEVLRHRQRLALLHANGPGRAQGLRGHLGAIDPDWQRLATVRQLPPQQRREIMQRRMQQLVQQRLQQRMPDVQQQQQQRRMPTVVQRPRPPAVQQRQQLQQLQLLLERTDSSSSSMPGGRRGASVWWKRLLCGLGGRRGDGGAST